MNHHHRHHHQPTPVVDKESRIAWLHRSSAKRSQTLNRFFLLPVTRHIPAHRIFCWAFQWGQFLKRCSRVWARYGPYQHLAVGLFFVHLRYLLASETMACLQLVESRCQPLVALHRSCIRFLKHLLLTAVWYFS